LEKGLKVYEKYNDKIWGLVDCISFVTMRDNAVTQVLTFDLDFAQAGFTVLKN
jgi:predicted nucleic acid-binding protein